jgi:hypothetical protein
MSWNGLKSIALYVTAGIGLLLVLVAALLAAEYRRAQAETGAVLSAFFAEDVLRDIDNWGAGRAPEIVISRIPAPRKIVPGTSPPATWFAQSSRMTRASFFLNNLFSTPISTDLDLPRGAKAIFVYPSDLGTGTSSLEARFADNFGYFVVSHIGLNLDETEALLYVDHFCGGLCGGGNYILMRKVNGAWHVVDHYLRWVS